MTIHRFAQLSDIHFGQERDGTLMVHDDVRRMLLKDAAKLAETRGPADLVIIAGDIAYDGTEARYKEAGEWIDQLTNAVKCRDTDVRVVPGNHDCDRSTLTWVARTVHKTIRAGSPKSAYGHLEDMAKDAEEASPILPKLRAYRAFAAGYDSDFTSVGRPLWIKDFPLAVGISLRLVGMNSVQVSDDEDSPGNMILGSAQYILPEEPHLVYAVIMHHPLHWFMDKSEAAPYLNNRARLIIVGHEHIPNVTMSTDVQKHQRLDIHSGATNPPEQDGLYRYAYNWIEISFRDDQSPPVLAVTVLPRQWVPERTQFAAATQWLDGQDSVAFEIACPFVKPAALPAAASTATLSHATTMAAASSETSSTPGADPSTGGTMNPDDEAALAKLKFLFWRYLNWQERIKALVKADALPSSANQPVPQTMERLALESARENGRLAAVWDAVMPFVPEAKKQANPFKKMDSWDLYDNPSIRMVPHCQS